MTPIDVLTAGEAMVMLAPHGPLGEADAVDLRVGGAEANVACFLAAAGRPTAWLGALGADPFGDRVQAHLERYGVDTRHVRRDPGRPTGLYAKDPSPTGETAVWYYRRGSAASGMGPDAAAAVAGARRASCTCRASPPRSRRPPTPSAGRSWPRRGGTGRGSRST